MGTTWSRHLAVAVARHFRQHDKLLPLVDKDSAGTHFAEVLENPVDESYLHSLDTFSCHRDRGILGYLDFRMGAPDSSKPIRLRLAELSPARVDAEEQLEIGEEDKLGLGVDEEDKKDLVVGHNPAVDSGKH